MEENTKRGQQYPQKNSAATRSPELGAQVKTRFQEQALVTTSLIPNPEPF